MKVQMYNIRRTNKDLSFRRSFSFVRLCLVESLSVDGSFLPHMLGKEPGLSCRRCVCIESTSKTIFLEVHRANHKFSLWLWKEILTLDSNKLDPQPDLSFCRLDSHAKPVLPLCFCGCCSPEQHHDFLPY